MRFQMLGLWRLQSCGGIYWIYAIAFSVHCTGNNFNLIKINVNQIDETAAEGFHISHILLYRVL